MRARALVTIVAPRSWAVVVVLMVGCDPAAPILDAGPLQPPSDARLRWKDGFPSLVGTSTGPGVYEAAGRRWRTATVAFSLGDLETSAKAFLELSEDLRRSEVDHPAHRGAFRAARCMAYENVGAIYRGLDDPETGSAILRRAEIEDPDCRHTINRTLSRFEASEPARRDAGPTSP